MLSAIMDIVNIFRRIRLKYFTRFADKYDFNKILNCQGIKVGRNTIFYDPNSISIDRTRPWMLEIGDYCKVCKGVTILAHDYSRSVLRRSDNIILGEAGITSIGNNVFIGINSIILMGTKIGNNVIIGAGSVVSGNIPSNVVIAGNPAKIIRSLDEHLQIRKQRMERDAYIYISSFYDKYKRYPKPNELGPFFVLFLERDADVVENNNINLQWNGDDASEILNSFLNSNKKYSSITDFMLKYGKTKYIIK